MRSISICLDDRVRPHRARGHDEHGAVVHRPDLFGVNAAGSLRASALDYGRFLATLPSGRLVPIEMMATRCVEVERAIGWGLGVSTLDTAAEPMIWPWGDDPGWKSFLLANTANGKGIVVLTNSDRGSKLIVAETRHHYGALANPEFEYLDWIE
jgi:Beta-lactamase